MTSPEQEFMRAAEAGSSRRRFVQFSITRAVRYILRMEGVAGLYRGVSLNFIKTAPAMSISFTLYDRFRNALGVPPSKYSATT
jgi:Mitochondrial carrier protein